MAAVTFEGSVNAAWEARLRAALVRGLVEGELEVVPQSEVEAHVDPATCGEGGCAVAVSEAVDARYVIVAHITHRDRTYAFSLDAYHGRGGDLVASSSDRCSLCGSQEAQELLSRQAAALRAKLERSVFGPGQLSIITDPPGAQVRVDGQLRGETPLSLELAPGRHRVELSAEGRAPVVRSVDAVRGVSETLSEALPAVREADEATTPVQRRGRPMKVAGAVSLGLGAGSLAAGIALLVLDGSPRQSRCSGADVDAFGNCRQVYTSLPHGVAFTVVGAGLLGAGIGLIVAGARRDVRAPSPAQAGVRFTAGGLRGWF